MRYQDSGEWVPRPLTLDFCMPGSSSGWIIDGVNQMKRPLNLRSPVGFRSRIAYLGEPEC